MGVHRAVLSLFLLGCSSPQTSLFISLNGSGVTPTSLQLSVWDPHGPLVLDQVVQGKLPGSVLIVGLPDRTQKLRLAFADGDSASLLGSLAVLVKAGQETRASVTLQAGVADRDNDGVPDDIDDCPDQINREQRDADGDGIGNVCEPSDGGPFDLRAPGDLAAGVCNVWFCDGFENDLIAATEVTTADGKPRWAIEGLDATRAFAEIDFTGGALASALSLRFRMTPDVTDGGTVMTFQRLGPSIRLDAAANLTKILTGPTYLRFFVKLSRSPASFYDPQVSMAYVYWSGDETNNLELDATTDGVQFNQRFAFGTPSAKYTPVAVDWVSDWVCVEWSHQVLGSDGGGGTLYHSTVSVNGMPAATFDGTGTPNVYGGFLLGTDIQFRMETPDVTDFTQWIDAIKFDGQPIGCN